MSNRLGPPPFHPDSDSDRGYESYRDSDTDSVNEHVKITEFPPENVLHFKNRGKSLRRSVVGGNKLQFDAKYAPLLSNLDNIIKKNKKRLARL